MRLSANTPLSNLELFYRYCLLSAISSGKDWDDLQWVRPDQLALYPEDHELLEDKEHQASNDSGETFFVASLALFTFFLD
jgi:hypothetical protein